MRKHAHPFLTIFAIIAQGLLPQSALAAREVSCFDQTKVFHCEENYVVRSATGAEETIPAFSSQAKFTEFQSPENTDLERPCDAHLYLGPADNLSGDPLTQIYFNAGYSPHSDQPFWVYILKGRKDAGVFAKNVDYYEQDVPVGRKVELRGQQRFLIKAHFACALDTEAARALAQGVSAPKVQPNEALYAPAKVEEQSGPKNVFSRAWDYVFGGKNGAAGSQQDLH